MSRSVAVIDIGSNTVKLSIIQGGRIPQLLHRSSHTVRLARGVTKQNPLLSDEAMDDALDALEDLIEEAALYSTLATRVVATSAVREAENGQDFMAEVEDVCQMPARILAGLEEAALSGRGVMTDPNLRDLAGNFSTVDLGGGSLEFVDFVNGEVEQIASFPLGAVRLTEAYIPNAKGFVPYDAIQNIYELTRKTLIKQGQSEIDFTRVQQPMIGCGGAFTALRAIQANRKGIDLLSSTAIIDCSKLGDLVSEIIKIGQDAHAQLLGISSDRAEILPAALGVLLATAEIAGLDQFIHSFHNLSYGVADEALASL